MNKHNRIRIRLLNGTAIVAAVAFTTPVLADSAAYRGPQPVQNAPAPQVRVIDKEQAAREQQQRLQMQGSQPHTQPVPAQGAYHDAQPKTHEERVAMGLAVDPNNKGSGPDKSRFRIVDEDTARREQGRLNDGSSSGRASDGTGGGENTSGN